MSFLLFLLLSSTSYSVDTSQAAMLNLKADIVNAPVVVYVTDFNEMAAQQFSNDMQTALNSGEPIIPVVIDSYGGSIYAFLRMADTIKSVNVPVATICIGKCMSAGAMLLAMGKEGLRFASPNATILLHEASSHLEGKLKDIKNEALEIDRLNNLIFTMIAQNVGKPDNFFLDLISKKGNIDWFLSSKEAYEYNLVNWVKLPTIKIKVITKMTFE